MCGRLTMTKKLILDLCGGTGAWSKYYQLDSDYDVFVIDPLASANDAHNRKMDLHKFSQMWDFTMKVHGVLFAPPCTHFCSSGARWWNDKDNDGRTAQAVDVVLEGIHIIEKCQPEWWCMENPVGRLPKLVKGLGKPEYFHPYEYAEYAEDPSTQYYTKKTCLWGDFTIPPEKYNKEHVIDRTKIHYVSPGPNRWRERSITPDGFARAFYEFNK